jgi:hypothetical protein
MLEYVQVPRFPPPRIGELARFRLLHHAHVCQTSGESVRLTQAMAGKGVNALT